MEHGLGPYRHFSGGQAGEIYEPLVIITKHLLCHTNGLD